MTRWEEKLKYSSPPVNWLIFAIAVAISITSFIYLAPATNGTWGLLAIQIFLTFVPLALLKSSWGTVLVSGAWVIGGLVGSYFFGIMLFVGGVLLGLLLAARAAIMSKRGDVRQVDVQRSSQSN